MKKRGVPGARLRKAPPVQPGTKGLGTGVGLRRLPVSDWAKLRPAGCPKRVCRSTVAAALSCVGLHMVRYARARGGLTLRGGELHTSDLQDFIDLAEAAVLSMYP